MIVLLYISSAIKVRYFSLVYVCNLFAFFFINWQPVKLLNYPQKDAQCESVVLRLPATRGQTSFWNQLC